MFPSMPLVLLIVLITWTLFIIPLSFVLSGSHCNANQYKAQLTAQVLLVPQDFSHDTPMHASYVYIDSLLLYNNIVSVSQYYYNGILYYSQTLSDSVRNWVSKSFWIVL